MFKAITRRLVALATRRKLEERRAAIESWTLFFGREAAELWLQALSERDAARISNA